MTETQVWRTTDDRGVTCRLIVDYDEQGVARVTREAFTELLIRAGLRREMEDA
jgi:hypothetical protein